MVIFGAGVVTGGLLIRKLTPPQPLPPPRVAGARPPGANTPGGTRLQFLRRAERELDLTNKQREEVDKILSVSQERTKRLMEPITPQLRDELQQTKEEIRAVLTPEQRKRFDELLKQQHPGEAHHGPGRGPENSSLVSPGTNSR